MLEMLAGLVGVAAPLAVIAYVLAGTWRLTVTYGTDSTGPVPYPAVVPGKGKGRGKVRRPRPKAKPKGKRKQSK